MATTKLGVALKASLEKLFGPTLHVSGRSIEMQFPTAFERLHTTFFRTKVTSWMAAQEEDYRYAIWLVAVIECVRAMSMMQHPNHVGLPLHYAA